MSNKDPHKYYPPFWTHISRFAATLSIGAVIILPWQTEQPIDWVVMFVVALIAMFTIDVIHDAIVIKPLRQQWVREHIAKYHPEDIDKLPPM